MKAAPKVAGKKNNVFKLHKDDHVTWTEAKMRRENEYQPWQIKLGSGRAARRFKAIKEGGVGENASYFIFYKPKDSSDSYEVCPIDEWYSVSATQRYKTLTAEEAEQKFEQRHKTLNLFSVMQLKKTGEAGEEGGTSGDSRAFKVSELDDWEESGDDFDGSEEDGDVEGGRKNRKKKSFKKEKDEPEDAPEEGKEDSDEGDFEQREVDYMSDSSSDSSESGENIKEEGNVKGIAEEEALRDLLSTDDEEDAEGNSPQKSNSNFNPTRNTLGTVDIKQEDDAEGSDESSDSDDYDVDEDKMDSLFMKKSLPAQLVVQGGQDIMDGASNTTSNSSSSQSKQNNCSTLSSSTISATRRKAPDDETIASSSSQANTQPPPRRPRPADSSSPANSQEKAIEDLVKKYLRRKPLPLKVLLKDIRAKLKRQGAANSDIEGNLVETIAIIMRRLGPVKQKINDTTYFSLPN